MLLLIQCLIGVWFVSSLFFAARLFCAPFSESNWSKFRGRRRLHAIWGFSSFINFVFVYWLVNPAAFHSVLLDRRSQRKTVAARVQSAGGWTVLQKDCETFASQHRDEKFYWNHGDTNLLPSSILALHPMVVRFEPLNAAQGQPPVVRIRVFGMHQTGWYAVPYYGLDVVCGTNAQNYKPTLSPDVVSGNRHDTYKKITTNIYEIY